MTLARVFAAHGHELVLVARRKETLQALADEIAAKAHPKPIVLPADLAQLVNDDQPRRSASAASFCALRTRSSSKRSSLIFFQFGMRLLSVAAVNTLPYL